MSAVALDGYFLIYARVSQDPKMRMASVPQQTAEGIAEAAGLGIPSERVIVIADQAKSASEFAKGKGRSGWPEVLALLDAGTVSHLYTWEGSRTARTLDGHVELRKALRGRKVLWHYGGEVYDMTNGRDRKIVGNDAVAAEHESWQTSERIKRHVRHSAMAGLPHGKVPFGYERLYSPDTGKLLGQVPHAIEAPIVKEAAARFAAGESARSILTDFNERGVPRAGKAEVWTRDYLQQLLTSVTQNGKRGHKGLITEGQWEANIDDATFSKIAVRYADPSRCLSRDNKPTHLLTGIARCGKCLGTLEAAKTGNGKASYRCSVTPHLTRAMRFVDEQVEAVMIDFLETGDPMALNPPAEDDPATQEEARLKAILADAFAAYDADEISVTAYAAKEKSTKAKLAALRRQQVKAVPLPEAVIDLFGPGAAERWAALDTDTRRTAVRRLLSVTVLPAPKGLNTYDPNLLEVERIVL